MTHRALAQGERVYLRPLEPSDAPRLARFLAVPEVRAALRLGPGTPEEDVAFADALVEPKEALVLAIAAIADGRLLGLCGLETRGEGREAELGIFVGDPVEWGKGYGGEATRLLVAHGFRALGLERIRLEVREDHLAAIRAYERAGFRLDRPAAARPRAPGGPAPLAVMSVLRSEWPPRAPAR